VHLENIQQIKTQDKKRKPEALISRGKIKFMKNKMLIGSVLIASVMVFMSCSKDDDKGSDNPFNGKTTAVFNHNVSYGTVTDQDGNVYKTVTIDTQTWMAENLRTTKYNDGTTIPGVTKASEWESLTDGAYCNIYNTKNTDTIATYGRLYNWYAVNTGKLAPKGWHIPSNVEWAALATYLGGESVAGYKLKETGTTHWKGTNTDATNETGFTALPGGYRDYDGAFSYFAYYGVWWSSTGDGSANAWDYFMSYVYDNLKSLGGHKTDGISVRCVKD
jgi:uncharacterized protein (TIGR02145 family)